MQIRKYRAPTVKEAIAKAKAELGSDAILLHQREVIEKTPTELYGHTAVEITVAVDQHIGSNHIPAHADAQITSPLSSPGTGYDDLRRELLFIRKLLQRQNAAKESLPAALLGWHSALTDCNLPTEIATELLQNLEEELTDSALNRSDLVLASLSQRMISAMPSPIGPLAVGQQEHPLIYVLVGPTGVGKTTTLAKLAAQYAIDKHLPVALITTDTFRIGAIGQLKTYCDLIQAPLEVAYTPEDLSKHVHQHQDKAVIFVDTPGRSPTDTANLNVLHGFAKVLPEPVLHIAIAAGTNYADAIHIVDKFSVIPPQAILVTKLDETAHFGAMYRLSIEQKIPFSYFTIGQSVPEDIEVATSDLFVKRLLQHARRIHDQQISGMQEVKTLQTTNRLQSYSFVPATTEQLV
jgi:flagellar biosynthesis protein FlhF